MKSIIKKQIPFTLLLMLLSGFTYAESTANLPTSSQLTNESNENNNNLEEPIVPEIVIQTDEGAENSTSNLKQGEACDDQTMNTAITTPTEYKEIPLAKTIPCSQSNCKNLQPAMLKKYNHEKIPVVKIKKLKPCIKK